MSDLHVDSTHGDSAVQAQRWLTDRNDELLWDVWSRTVQVTDPLDPAGRTALVAFCVNRVLPHLAVTDSVLYASAEETAEAGLLVHALRLEHRIIARHVHELDTADVPGAVRVAAQSIVTVLATCFEVQRTVLFPALARVAGVDLPGLAEERDTLLRIMASDESEVPGLPETPSGWRPRTFGPG